MQVYETLYKEYGPQHWWPSESPLETVCGALLAQNTAWTNAYKAVCRLKADPAWPEPEKLLAIPMDKLEELIRSSGYFRQKAERLKIILTWWLENVENDNLKAGTTEFWRNSLLSLKGVGPETADSILLYAFHRPIFVIDAYTKRIMIRHFGAPEKISYDELQSVFMKNLKKDALLFNEFHALFVRCAYLSCLKNECSCPLGKLTVF